MKALISTTEPRQTGYRVAEVAADGATFSVADTMFWVSCANSVVQDEFWYDPSDQTIKPNPVPPEPEPAVEA